MRFRKLWFVASASFVLAVSGASALAESGTSSGGSNDSTETHTSTQVSESGSLSDSTSSDSTSSSEHTGANAEIKSGQGTDSKLKVCQVHETNANRIIARIVERGQKQLDLFNTIAQKVEAFKTSHNLTVANYDQLVATLLADQTKATTDLTTMKANSTIDCNSSDPKAMVTAFKADLKQEISDLRTYKTDVKNLIVAVKTAAGVSDSNSNDSNTSSNNSGSN